jgi:hypothetical protein
MAKEFNQAQKTALRFYDEGSFEGVTSVEEVEEAGDTLLVFILRELDSSEDCDTMGEAVRRMETAQAQLRGVIDGLADAEVAEGARHET